MTLVPAYVGRISGEAHSIPSARLLGPHRSGFIICSFQASLFHRTPSFTHLCKQHFLFHGMLSPLAWLTNRDGWKELLGLGVSQGQRGGHPRGLFSLPSPAGSPCRASREAGKLRSNPSGPTGRGLGWSLIQERYTVQQHNPGLVCPATPHL